MRIEYSAELQKKLKDFRSIVKYYSKLAKPIMTRLSQLEAANVLSDIPHTPPTRRHKLTEGSQSIWAVDISRNYRMTFIPLKGTELDEITEIRILEIKDYH